jgi:hypothetical protein
MNLWRDILDQKNEKASLLEMNTLARSAGYKFFVHNNQIFEVGELSLVKREDGPDFKSVVSAKPTDKTPDDCMTPEVWCIHKQGQVALDPELRQPVLFASLPVAVTVAKHLKAEVAPWGIMFHELRRAKPESRIIVPS